MGELRGPECAYIQLGGKQHIPGLGVQRSQGPHGLGSTDPWEDNTIVLRVPPATEAWSDPRGPSSIAKSGWKSQQQSSLRHLGLTHTPRPSVYLGKFPSQDPPCGHRTRFAIRSQICPQTPRGWRCGLCCCSGSACLRSVTGTPTGRGHTGPYRACCARTDTTPALPHGRPVPIP